MQPSKSKNTRYQPRALYAVAALLFCASVTVCVSLEYDLPWINQAIALLPSHNYVHWRTRAEAMNESKKTHKAILFFIMGKKDGRSLELDAQALGDPRIAEVIDNEFIPVQYWFDRKEKDHEIQADYRYFRDTMQLTPDNCTPCVVAVAPNLIDAKVSDLASSSNLVELGINESDLTQDGNQYFPNHFYGGHLYHGYNSFGPNGMRDVGAVQYGYSDKKSFVEFLYGARVWHKLAPTVGRVNWLPLADLKLDQKSTRPRLLVFVQDIGLSSDTMRLNLFWKNAPVKLINDSFEPYLIEFHHGDPAYNSKFAALRKKYNITELPALVVLDATAGEAGVPPVEHGFASAESTVDFLKATLDPGHKMKKRRWQSATYEGTD
jgi:hypothetical protein